MNRVVKFFGIAAAGWFAVQTVSAQAQPNYGDDPETCKRNMSLYRSDYDHKNYDAAIVYWRKVWKDCPQSSPNLTLHGLNMYKFFIEKELDQNKKKALLDTLMQVYEKGMVLRPQNRGTYLVAMSQDIINYANTPENQPQLLKILEDIMTTAKESATALTYASYMRIIMTQNAAGQLSDEELIENYNKVSDYISDAIKQSSNEELARARDAIDDSFITSTAASCENLLKIYGEKYDANKEDVEFLRKLTRNLVRKECTDAELFEKASEQLYALNPSSAAAYNMAMLFLRRENFEKAVEYFEYAIERETESVEKAKYNQTLGQIMLSRYNRFNDAKRYANEAIKLRPDWGQPYVLLATTYASGPKIGEDDFEKAYVYWIVVDKLQRARQVDPDIAPMVDPMIRQFQQHFPKKEEGFFRGINEGATINVGGWVGESTRARFPN